MPAVSALAGTENVDMHCAAENVVFEESRSLALLDKRMGKVHEKRG